MSLLKSFLGEGVDGSNVLDFQRLRTDFQSLQESVEGLRFSKRDLAHELVLLVRENARLEEQVFDMKERLERLEAILKQR